MSREEAIRTIKEVWASWEWDNEFTSAVPSRAESQQRLRDCLIALGVSAEEAT